MEKTNHETSSIQILGEGAGRNVYYKTEMLTATTTDDTDKHQPSLPKSMQHIPSSKANSKNAPHLMETKSLITLLIAVISMHQ
jgi:hypothetical protein